MKVCLDAGHGGRDTGAAAADGYPEKAYTLTQVLVDESILHNGGIESVLTRRDDEYVGLSRRAQIANEAGVDAFLSFHFNASASEGPSGTQMLHWKTSDGGERLARELLAGIGPLDGDEREPWERLIAVPDPSFRDGMRPTVLAETRMPAVIVETEFGTDPEAAVLLQNPTYQVEVAKATLRALRRWQEGGS